MRVSRGSVQLTVMALATIAFACGEATPTDGGLPDANTDTSTTNRDARADTSPFDGDLMDAGGPDPYADFAQLHVDVAHPMASDANPGTVDQPFSTIGAGFRAALAQRAADRDTRVWVHPGIYREVIVDENLDSSGATIVIQGTERGAVFVDGSDIVSTSAAGAGRYEIAWPHNWFGDNCEWVVEATSRYHTCDPHRRAGNEATFVGGMHMFLRTEAEARALNEMFVRHEVVWVDDVRLTQVLNEGELVDNSYWVDEAGDRIVVQAPSGEVEVGMREMLWNPAGMDDYVLKDLIFEHAATPATGSEGAVRLADADRVLLDGIEVRQNAFDGLSLQFVSAVDIVDCVMDDNGFNGIAGHVMIDLTISDTRANSNNWRGHAALVHGWSVGNKLLKARRLTVRRFTANDNLAHGFWLDFDISDAVVEDSEFCRNLGSGILSEANQGPITLRNNHLCDNIRLTDESAGGAGLETRETNNFTLTGNLIEGNWVAFQLNGGTQRNVMQFDTCESSDRGACQAQCDRSDPATEGIHTLPSGCVCGCLSNRDWTVNGNTMRGTGDGIRDNGDSDRLIWSSLANAEITALFASSTWDANTYSHTDGDEVFGINGCGFWMSLEDWRTCTNADATSTFVP